MSERRLRYGIASVLGIWVLIAYIETMAGSASFWDAGEFIASAYTLGIPHPPATPLYVVLGRVFTMLPLPLTIAQKVNFMSAFFGALGVVVLFLLAEFLIRQRRGNPNNNLDRFVLYGCALVGALFTAWSNTYWNNSIEAEVYSISSFVMGVTTLLALRWSQKPEEPASTRYVYLIIYLLSLGVGFHLGTVLTYPAIALYLLLFRKKSLQDVDLIIFSAGFFLFLGHVNLKWSGPAFFTLVALFALAGLWRSLGGKRFVAVCTGLFILGVSIHLVLMLRSSQNPGIDEANPETFENLMKVLRREQYPPSSIFVRKASWHFQIVEHFWRYCTEQWSFIKDGFFGGARSAMIPIFVGLCGLASMAWTRRRSFLLLGGTLAITSIGMIIFLNFSDREVRERDYFYSGAFYFFGIFISVGAAALLDWFFGDRQGTKKDKDKQLDRIGYLAGVSVLLFLTFMLYNRYHFEHDRTHERVPWGYGYNMLAGLEPNSVIFTNGDNDTFPLWYQQEVENFRTDVRVINLSLLNTDWYPEQLRDNEPKVHLSLSNRDIRALPARCFEIYQQTGKLHQPRDLAVKQIIRDNFGKKEIYFAVTIPRETLSDYMDRLVLEGIVYRFQRQRGTDQKDYAKMRENVDKIYRYDGILTPEGKHDTSIYRDSNQETLVQNYASAFIRLGQHLEEQAAAGASPQEQARLFEEAISRYEYAYEIAPNFDQLGLVLAGAYLEGGQEEKAIELYERLISVNPENERFEFELARAYLATGRDEDAVRSIRSVAKKIPEDPFFHQFLIHTLWYLGRAEEAQVAVNEWNATRPGDDRMIEFFEMVQQGATESWDRPGSVGTWRETASPGDSIPGASTIDTSSALQP